MTSADFNPEDMYHMFDLKMLDNNVWYFENVLSYPEELLSFVNEVDLNKASHSIIPEWKDWMSSSDDGNSYGSFKDIDLSKLKDSTGDKRLDQKIRYIANSFTMATDMCFDRYMDGHGLDKSQYSIYGNSLHIKKWTVGQYMGPHFDGQDGHSDLAFSMVTYLNDNYEGGEIHFKNQNITVKPKAGSLLFFPSQEPYVHEVKRVISGDRYMSPLSVYKKQ